MQRLAGVVLLVLGLAAAYVGLSLGGDLAFRLGVLVFAAIALTAAALNLMGASGGLFLGRLVAALGLGLGVVALAVGVAGSGTPDWGDLVAAIFVPAGVLLMLASLLVLALLRRPGQRTEG